MVKPLGIVLLSLASVAVAATAYADGSPFGSPFGGFNNQGFNNNDNNFFKHDKGCSSSHCVAAAPEIDPASALSALTLLGGGLLVLRGRTKKK